MKKGGAGALWLRAAQPTSLVAVDEEARDESPQAGIAQLLFSHRGVVGCGPAPIQLIACHGEVAGRNVPFVAQECLSSRLVGILRGAVEDDVRIPIAVEVGAIEGVPDGSFVWLFRRIRGLGYGAFLDPRTEV